MLNEQPDAGPNEHDANPALEALAPLVGDWHIILSNASFLDDPSVTMESTASIRWVQHAAFLLLSQGTEGDMPSAHWLIGHDDSVGEYTVLYSDRCGVSRVYSMSLVAGEWRKWRAAPGFYQRFHAQLSEDGRTIKGQWGKSTDGQTWTMTSTSPIAAQMSSIFRFSQEHARQLALG